MSLLASSYFNNLPSPEVIGSLVYEEILQELKDEVIAYAPELESVLALESEPTTKQLEVFAYRILHERMLANNYGLSLMLAKGKGAQLDNLGALPFIRTSRKVLIQEDINTVPPVEEVTEPDDEYRVRLHIALEGFTTAGSRGAYIYHGLSAHENIIDIAVDSPTFSRHQPEQSVRDLLPEGAIILIPDHTANLTDPMPGDVAVTALSRLGNGTASTEEIEALDTALDAEKIRPINDNPRSRSSHIKTYAVVAEVWFYPGPDSSLVLAHAKIKSQEYTESCRRIGHDVAASGLDAAIHQPGVQKVNILEPANGVSIAGHESSYCTGITLINKGVAV